MLMIHPLQNKDKIIQECTKEILVGYSFIKLRCNVNIATTKTALTSVETVLTAMQDEVEDSGI